MIKLSNICKSINQTPILKNVSLEIEKGEFVAIIGQSGSGKTSLLNIIGTLDSPSSGSYIFENYEVTTLSKDEKARLRREKIGFIFQRYNLLSLLSAGSNVVLPAIYAGKTTEEREQKAKKILSELELGHKFNARPNELSGGQQQRVSIARALINGGELILADEPTGALDSRSGIMVLEILQKLNKEGHTIILVTHDKDIAAKAKRVIEIKDGEVLSDTKQEQSQSNYEIHKMPKEKKNYTLFKNQISECFKMSITSIIAHKLRSVLTMLGIIIGIASVVCVVALGLGTQQKVLSSISAIGTNTIQIVAGRGLGDIRSGRTRLSLSDLNVLNALPYLEAAEADVRDSSIVTYANTSLQARVNGVGVNRMKIRGLKLAAGRFINDIDIKENANIAVLDDNGRKNLFHGISAEQILNKVVIYDSQPLRIVGVLQRQDDQSGFDPTNGTVELYVPYTTVMNKITGDKRLRSIVAKLKDGVDPNLTEQTIAQVLEIKRGKKDFFMVNSDAIQKAVEANTLTLTLLIASIAVISLIVGGIGVMNIMLVSVSERTREIGIRMAIGARKEDILIQFLLEAVLICTIGAILGVALSFGVMYVFNQLSKDFLMIMSYNSIFLGLLSSVMIGIIFGFFPARNAANLNPINALSKE
ncbi:ABC transporter permease [Campylobacter sp. US33a]|uniref:Pyoverdine export ATP-binding/permease protein PvdT n=1 Tax=Campylobacter sp. CCS1377 TaxID=3158229 RepID=A0AAU7E5S8_9BACT|nr:ABC transporter permease [Campylobacter sp. US33a]MCW1360822.1 ABC transporter permease [Campylobacter jejuni]TEY01157.1 ATP-binding cassette domain-containing protein [Campylobacter sp. US33a]